MSQLEQKSVIRVRDALVDAGLEGQVVELEKPTRVIDQAATLLGCEPGAIVSTRVFAIDRRLVIALVAGDHRCLEQNLPAALFIKGDVRRPGAGEVRGATGFAIGGVSPIGLVHNLPMLIDRSLKRFDSLYVAAGHPSCVFPIGFADLARVTGATVSWNIAEPLNPDTPSAPALKRSKTFSKQSN